MENKSRKWSISNVHCIVSVSFINFALKPMRNIGKVSVNASILYKNQEIWENSTNAFSIFVYILMAGVFVSRDENSLLNLVSLIIRKR